MEIDAKNRVSTGRFRYLHSLCFIVQIVIEKSNLREKDLGKMENF